MAYFSEKALQPLSGDAISKNGLSGPYGYLCTYKPMPFPNASANISLDRPFDVMPLHLIFHHDLTP